MKQFWSLIILIALASSCTRVNQSANDVFLPRLAPAPAGSRDARQQVLLVGRLVVDQGCIKVGDNGTVTVLWHSEVELAQKSPPMLRDNSTGRTYRIGDQVQVGGGSVDPATVERELKEVATRCGPPYFKGYFSN